MHNTELHPPKPRSMLRWWILGFSATTLLITGWCWSKIEHQLESRLNSIRTSGLPTSAAELNAYYEIPADETNRTREWVDAIDSLDTAASSLPNSLREIAEIPGSFPPPTQPWTDYESNRQVVNELEDEFQLLRAAASRPGFVRYPIDCTSDLMTFLSQIRKIRRVARLLVLDTNVSAHQGQHSRILDDIELIDSLSDTMQRGPIFIFFLVRSAIYAAGTREIEKWLSYCNWSDIELESIQAAILSANFEEEAVRCLNGERAYGLTGYRMIPLGPFRPSSELGYVNLIQDCIDTFSFPWPEPIERQADLLVRLSLRDKQPLSSFRYYTHASIGDAIEQFGDCVARAVAQQRCGCLLIAAQRFRLKHGRLPRSLDEIEKTLLGPGVATPELRIDPFNGQPLCFLSDAEGIAIYSVSKDLIDNRGETSSPATNIRDVGFKLLQNKMVYDPEPRYEPR